MLRLTSKTFLQQLRNSRGIHSSRALLKAEFFRMPAMSPTMEKGGVTDWKFKEGDAFNSGDVLLEVETDKAQIDVEAQDDGILAKILIQNGASDIPVGTPIAILAEEGDDLSTLELPTESSKESSSSAAAPKEEAPKAEEPKKEVKKETKPAVHAKTSKPDPKQVFFPSVSSLLHENNISRDDALSKITASGPKGRILKGDVLAYLGKISQDSVNQISSFIETQSKLDLSNIEKLKITPKESSKESSSSSSSSSSTPAAPQKPIKKEPKVISRTYNLENLYTLQAEAPEKGLKPFTIKSYLEKASKRAEQYAYKSHPLKSDFYDPVFESLVAPTAQTDRFSIKLDIPVEAGQSISAVDPIDAFDLFDSQDSLFNGGVTNSEFTVKLTLNEKVLDSEEKAKLYLKKLESYIQV